MKALTKDEGDELWQEHLDNPNIDRDNCGFRGRLQLWIPKSKSRIDQSETYVDAAAQQGSKPIKDPKEKDIDLMQDHVKRQSLSCGGRASSRRLRIAARANEWGALAQRNPPKNALLR